VTAKKVCTATATVSITQPDTLLCSVSGKSEVLAGGTGTLTANVTGGSGTYSNYWTVNNAAWVIADPKANPVSFTAPNGVSTATFTVYVTDTNGCTTHCTETVACSSPTLISDTIRCTLQNNCGSSTVNSFRLIFGQDPQNMPCYRLIASNPGQFYYNVFFTGTPGFTSNVTVTLPYPFVTQGANPIEVYDGFTSSTSGSQTCLIPGNKTFAGSTQVTLADYGNAPVVGTTTKTISLSFNIPPSGSVYLAIHMDYGLKQTTGFGQNTSGDATKCSTNTVVVTNGVTYKFATCGAGSGSATVSSCNDFKKSTGTAGITVNSLSVNPLQGANVVLKDSKSTVLGSSTTDSDGWYMINYKWTGKAATFYVTMTPPVGLGKAQTKTITLKSNGFIEADFTTP